MTYLADLIDVLNMISQNNQAAQKPADIAFGTVISISPLSIQVEGSMQSIPAAAIVLTSAVVERIVDVDGVPEDMPHLTVKVTEGLLAGDKVAMLRVSKGNRYIVLSKVQ